MKTLTIALFLSLLVGCGGSDDPNPEANNNSKNNTETLNNPPEDQDPTIALRAQVTISEDLETPWSFASERPVGTMRSAPDEYGIYYLDISTSAEVSGHSATISFSIGKPDSIVVPGVYELVMLHSEEEPVAVGAMVFADLESTYEGQGRHTAGTIEITSIEDGPTAQTRTISGTFSVQGEGSFVSGKTGAYTYDITEGSFEGVVITVI